MNSQQTRLVPHLPEAPTDITTCLSHSHPVCRVRVYHHHHPQGKEDLPPVRSGEASLVVLSPQDHHGLCTCLALDHESIKRKDYVPSTVIFQVWQCP